MLSNVEFEEIFETTKDDHTEFKKKIDKVIDKLNSKIKNVCDSFKNADNDIKNFNTIQVQTSDKLMTLGTNLSINCTFFIYWTMLFSLLFFIS